MYLYLYAHLEKVVFFAQLHRLLPSIVSFIQISRDPSELN